MAFKKYLFIFIVCNSTLVMADEKASSLRQRISRSVAVERSVAPATVAAAPAAVAVATPAATAARPVAHASSSCWSRVAQFFTPNLDYLQMFLVY